MFSLSLWWGNCLDLHGGWGEGGDLLLHPVGDAGVHGGPSGEDNVGVEVLPDVHVALHDRVEGGLVHPAALHPDEGRLEERLGSPEPLVSNCDHLEVEILILSRWLILNLPVGKLVRLLERGRRCCGGHLLLKVERDVAELLLDVPHDLPLGGGGEAVASLSQEGHQLVCQITASKVEPENYIIIVIIYCWTLCP